MNEHIVIIGNGVAGVTTARFIRKLSDHKITIISSESKHFFSRTALMYVYMGHMKFDNIKPYEDHFWEKNNIDLLMDSVDSINTSSKSITLQNGGEMSFDKLVLATGSIPAKYGWPGQDLEGVQGLFSLQDLESMEKNTKDINRAVIIGGGLIGVEMAEMLHSRKIPVTYLVRETGFAGHFLPKEESEMIARHIKDNHIDLRLESEMDAIQGDENGRVKSITTKDGETIDCQFVGLTAGVLPNINFLKESGVEMNRGLLVDQFQETNIKGIYAVGDCSEIRNPAHGRRGIEPVWYTAKEQGKIAAHNICGHETPYKQGIWYNSAKFFEIEYQVYGDIRPTRESDVESFYWEHKDGQKSIRIDYKTESKSVIGFNLMGIRYRQNVCEKWIKHREKIDKVMAQLSDANFDPEFFERHEKEMVAAFNAAKGTDIKLKKKNLFNIFD